MEAFHTVFLLSLSRQEIQIVFLLHIYVAVELMA